MKIAYLHNWSALGRAVGRALLDAGGHEVLLVGTRVDEDAIDRELLVHAGRSGAMCAMAGDVASPEFCADLSRWGPDVVLVATFPKLLPAPVLALPNRGAFNVHPSLLPAYRGALPEFWVIRNGEATTGVSIHRMNERFDAGNVVAQERVGIDRDETIHSLTTKLCAAAAPLAVECLARLGRGEPLEGVAQDERLATRARMPTPDDLAIRWQEPAASVERLVRACGTVLDAWTIFRGRPLVIRSAHARADGPSLGCAEMCFDSGSATLWVGAADGPLAVESVELEGRHLEASTFAVEARLASGEHLGAPPGSPM